MISRQLLTFLFTRTRLAASLVRTSTTCTRNTRANIFKDDVFVGLKNDWKSRPKWKPAKDFFENWFEELAGMAIDAALKYATQPERCVQWRHVAYVLIMNACIVKLKNPLRPHRHGFKVSFLRELKHELRGHLRDFFVQLFHELVGMAIDKLVEYVLHPDRLVKWMQATFSSRLKLSAPTRTRTGARLLAGSGTASIVVAAAPQLSRSTASRIGAGVMTVLWTVSGVVVYMLQH